MMSSKAIILFLSGLLIIAGATPLAGYAMNTGSSSEAIVPAASSQVIEGCPVPDLQGIYATPYEPVVAIDWLLLGTCVVFDARTQNSTWVRISASETKVSYPGWVQASKVTLTPGWENLPSIGSVTSGSGTSTSRFRACVIRTKSMNIRHGPGTRYLEIGHLMEGDCVDLTGRNADARWVLFDKGWLYAWYLQVEGDLRDLSVVVPPPPDFTGGKGDR